MSGMQRREFVQAGASGALLFGVPFARADELPVAQLAKARAAIPVGAPIAPTDWNLFRAEMRKRNQPGVIVLLQELAPQGKPNPVPAQRDAKQLKEIAVPEGECCNNHLATAINTILFNCGDSELPLLLVQAVFIAAPAEEVRKEFPALPTGAGLALIAADGKVQATLPVDADLGKKFADRVAQLIYGKDGVQLAERVKVERAALGEANCQRLDAALLDLDHDDFGRRQGASQVLTELFGKVPASLMQAFRSAPSLEVRVRIDSLFRKKLHDENTAALLQRSLAPHVAAQANFNVRVLCGQGALRPEAHRFVQLWSAAAAARA